jgi:hypothetical protein
MCGVAALPSSLETPDPIATVYSVKVKLVGGPLNGWWWPLKHNASTTLRFPLCVDLYFGTVDAVYDRQPNGDFCLRAVQR